MTKTFLYNQNGIKASNKFDGISIRKSLPRSINYLPVRTLSLFPLDQVEIIFRKIAHVVNNNGPITAVT